MVLAADELSPEIEPEEEQAVQHMNSKEIGKGMFILLCVK